jgi:hypothetical protein
MADTTPQPVPIRAAAADPRPADEPSVRFGDLPNQVMPASWAEAFLREIFTSNPVQFGKVLAVIVTGVPVAARGRRPSQ